MVVTLVMWGAELAQPNGSSQDSALRGALARAIASAESRRSVHVESECLLDSGRKSIQLYGTGVGIWDERSQFGVEDDRFVAVLRSFDRHDFLAMPESIGGRARKPAGRAQGPRVTCRVTLALAEGESTAVQLEGGEQSAGLKKLATEIIAPFEDPARRGTTVTSIEEGLAAVAQGRLAPEAFSLVAHFKPRDRTGWLLESRHGDLASRSFSERTGYGAARRLASADDQIRQLARMMSDAVLPSRLSLDEYTEVHVRVLNQRAEILARVFDDQPRPGAADRARFMKLRAELERLHQLVIEQGKPEPQGERHFPGGPAPERRSLG
jgi:hypothetical protein